MEYLTIRSKLPPDNIYKSKIIKPIVKEEGSHR